MMRPLLMALLILLALHFLGVMGLLGWLAATDRLDRERARQAIAVFEPTFAQQQQREAEQTAEAEREQAEQDRLARLEAVADGPRTMEDRLASERQADEVARLRLDRLQRDTADLRQQIERAKTLIAQQRTDLDAERDAFEAFVQERNDRVEDEEFQRAVSMYEQLRPAQAKQMFQELIAQGGTEDVVDYLAAMQLRRASKVIEQFREPQEIVQAAELIERLRQRGVYADPALPQGELARQEDGE